MRRHAACWWRRKQTSPRGTGAAALGALAILHSLPALQRWQNCTQKRHRRKQGRRCCIPAQYRRPAMTPPRPANRKRASSSRRRRRMPLNTAPTRLERFETWSNNTPPVGRLQVAAAAAGADKDVCDCEGSRGRREQATRGSRCAQHEQPSAMQPHHEIHNRAVAFFY